VIDIVFALFFTVAPVSSTSFPILYTRIMQYFDSIHCELPETSLSKRINSEQPMNVNNKGKGHPRTGHGGPEGE
jgi:hypothetical protein